MEIRSLMSCLQPHLMDLCTRSKSLPSKHPADGVFLPHSGGSGGVHRSKNGTVVQKRAIGSTITVFDEFYTVEKLRLRRMQLSACHKKL